MVLAVVLIGEDGRRLVIVQVVFIWPLAPFLSISPEKYVGEVNPWHLTLGKEGELRKWLVANRPRWFEMLECCWCETLATTGFTNGSNSSACFPNGCSVSHNNWSNMRRQLQRRNIWRTKSSPTPMFCAPVSTFLRKNEGLDDDEKVKWE